MSGIGERIRSFVRPSGKTNSVFLGERGNSVSGANNVGEADEIRLGLHPQLREVIDRLPPQTPDDFRRRAAIAAKFITDLDAGQVEGDEARVRFRDQLMNTGFIGSVYINHQIPGLYPDAPDPRVALPTWLYRDTKPGAESFEIGSNELRYQEWVQRSGFTESHDPNGTYYEIRPEDPSHSVPAPRTFKGYIEGSHLNEGLEGKLQTALADLTRESRGPNLMKLFEGSRLALYFYGDVDLADGIRETFNAHGLHFRGPAQDVWEVQVRKAGKSELEKVTSNDGALGEGAHTPIEYKLTRYTAAEFIDNYLQLCLWAGKAPDEPYKTSFVWLIDSDGKHSRDAHLARQAQEMVGYPVFYARHRLDVIDRKWLR